MSKVKKYSLLVVTALILCVSFVVGGLMISGNSEKVNAKGSGNAVYEMETGTSVSVNGDGLRFRVKMNEDGKNEIDDDSNPLSIVIVGHDVYEAGIAKNKTNFEIYNAVILNDACVEIKIPKDSIYQEGDSYYGNAVLAGLKANNNEYKYFAAFARIDLEFTETGLDKIGQGTLYNSLNAAINDINYDYSEKIFANDNYNTWFGVQSAVAVKSQKAYDSVIKNAGKGVLVKAKGVIPTEDVFEVTETDATYALEGTYEPSTEFTVSDDRFYACESEGSLIVSAMDVINDARVPDDPNYVNVLTVSYNGEVVKRITLVDLVIDDADEFDTWYAAYMNEDEAACKAVIVLNKDIDMKGKSYSHKTCSASAKPFTGIFDGRNHNIKNLTTQNGFFWKIDNGAFANVSVTNMTTGQHWYPMLGGFFAVNSTISNVYLQGNLPSGDHVQGNAFFNNLSYCVVENVVVNANRPSKVEQPDPVAQKATGNTIKNLFVIDTGILTSGASETVPEVYCYVSASDFAKTIKEIPEEFDNNVWFIDYDGVLKFKNAAMEIIKIGTKQALIDYFDDVTNYAKYAVLTADIDFERSAYKQKNWYENYHLDKLTGTFDGNGHVIKNLSGWAGFFPCVGVTGVIKNLAMIGFESTSTDCGIFAHEFSGTIENCYIQGTKKATIKATSQDTGVLGYSNATGMVVRNSVFVIDRDYVENIASPAIIKMDGSKLKGWSNAFFIENYTMDCESRINNGEGKDIEGATVYKTTGDFMKAVNEIPEGFDTKYWTMGLNGLCWNFADDGIAVKGEEIFKWRDTEDSAILKSGMTLTDDFVIDGFTLYKKQVTFNYSGNNRALLVNLWNEDGNVKIFSDVMFAVMLTEDATLFFSDNPVKLKANVWYVFYYKNINTDAPDLYISSVAANTGFANSNFGTAANRVTYLGSMGNFQANGTPKGVGTTATFYMSDMYVVKPAD